MSKKNPIMSSEGVLAYDQGVIVMVSTVVSICVLDQTVDQFKDPHSVVTVRE